MGKAKQPVTIDGIEFDALVSEERTLESTVPEYTVEDGFSVSDSIILGAEKLSMILYLSRTPVTWHKRHGNDPLRVDQIVSKIEDLYYAKTPVTIVTSDATYTDMAIESMTLRKSIETGYDREIPISFKKIRKTKLQLTTIPDSYGKSGSTAASAGSANTSTGTSENPSAPGSSGTESSASDTSNGNSDSSILYGIAAGVGLIS